MEASGHEELAEELMEVIKKFLESKKVNFEEDALYMGNWFSDFSQFIDEGIKLKVYNAVSLSEPVSKSLKNIIKNIEKYAVDKKIFKERLLKIIESSLNKKLGLEDEIKKKSIFKFLKKRLKTGILSMFNFGGRKIFNSIYSELELVTNSIISNLNHLTDLLDNVTAIKSKDQNLRNIKSVKESEILNYIEQSLFVFTKLLAFYKFVVNSSTSMDFRVFNEITNQILKNYFPHEHLDRFVDYDKLISIRYKQKDAIKKNFSSILNNDFQTEKAENYIKRYNLDQELEELKKLKDEGYFSSEKEYEEEVTEAINNINTSIQFYNYLDEYLLIACGNLAEHELFFRNIENKNYDEINLELARLGKTLHVFEDYFAHSNFIDYNILLLFQASKSENIDNESIKKIKDYFKSTHFTNYEMNKSIRSMIKVDEHVNKGSNQRIGFIDNKISTGYFGSEDIYVSLFHLLIGKLGNISEMNEEEGVFGSSNIKHLLKVAFVDESKEKIKILDNIKTFEDLERKRINIKKKENREIDKANKWLIRKGKTSGNLIQYNNKIKEIRKKYKPRYESLDEIISLNKRIQELEEHKKQQGSKNPKQDIPMLLTTEEVSQLFAGQGFSLFSKKPKKNQSKKEEENEQILKYLTIVINGLISARLALLQIEYVKRRVQLVIELIKFLEIIKVLIRIIRIVISYPTAIFRMIKLLLDPIKIILETVYPVYKEVLKFYVEKMIINILEDIIKPFLSEHRTGSHSLMAKDEEYEKKNLHSKAAEMAMIFDKVILKNLFTSKKDNIKNQIAKSLEKSNEIEKLIINNIEYKIPHDLRNAQLEVLYEYIMSQNEELKEEEYLNWFELTKQLCYEEGASILFNKKIPNYRIKKIKSKDEKEFKDLYNNWIKEQKYTWDQNNSKFNNKTSSLIHSKLEKSPSQISLNDKVKKYKTLDEQNISDKILNNNIMKIMLGLTDEIEITAYSKTLSRKELDELINVSNTVEKRISEKFKEANIIYTYFAN